VFRQAVAGKAGKTHADIEPQIHQMDTDLTWQKSIVGSGLLPMPKLLRHSKGSNHSFVHGRILLQFHPSQKPIK